MSEVIEISTFTLQPPLPSPPPTLLSSLKLLSSAPGLVALHWGPHAESPTTLTYVARWSSDESRQAFFHTRSPSWHSSFSEHLSSLVVLESSASPQDAVPALEAPCTEIFVSYGAEDDFLEKRLQPFVRAVTGANPPGLVGAYAGEFVAVRQFGVPPPKPKIAVMLLGWNTREDHDAQKQEGKVIANNIHLIRSGRESASGFHVNFTKRV
ncbi:hypothetical protein V8C44DRAFT_21664 [Trichoderma aethiopicum]